VNIAYSTLGEGPHLVWAAQAASGFTDTWVEPQCERFSRSFTVVRYFGRGGTPICHKRRSQSVVIVVTSSAVGMLTKCVKRVTMVTPEVRC
jgi:hypothetical protein